MSKKKTSFNPDWVNPAINKDWAKTFKEVRGDPFSVLCVICNRSVSLSNMGRAALTSHEKSFGHTKKLKAKSETQNTLTVFKALVNNSSQSSTGKNNMVTATLSTEPSFDHVSGFADYFSSEAVLKAEILWAMHTVESHSSLNSVAKSLPVIKAMFPKCEEAQKMKLSSKKLSYMITFGLAPYFHETLEEMILKCEFYVSCFDESLNKVAQRGQMDIVIRFWNKDNNIVESRYFKSVFMSGAKATDILDHFKKGLHPLKKDKLLQVSMDGPNVNWKFLKLLMDDPEINIINIGSCGLHVVHGAFQSGHKQAGWSVADFLRGIYWMFKDSPARRLAYKEKTGQSQFPLKFCSVRWVESSSAAYRSLCIVDSIKKYISDSETKLPSNISIKNVKRGLEDKLIKPKLAFFAGIASMLEIFLTKFQSPAPLVPFLYKSMEMLVRSILEKFVKRKISEKSINSLLKLNFEDNSIYVPVNEINVGFRVKKLLVESKASEKEKLQFFNECKLFLKTVVKKLFERSPLKYKLTKALSSLDPSCLTDEKHSKEKMNTLLEIFTDQNIISIENADKASSQFAVILTLPDLKESCSNFKNSPCNLDRFYSDLLASGDFKELFSVIRMVLIMSHGNAQVEGGFSINSQMLVENMHEQSLVARRQVFDALLRAHGSVNVIVDKKMMLYCKNAHFKYTQSMEDQKKIDYEENIRLQERKRASTEMSILEKKKAKINDIAAFESKEIDRRLNELRQKI